MQTVVIITVLVAATAMLLYAPEKTTDLNLNREVFYRFTWMPKYWGGNFGQMRESWRDRVFMPLLAGEYALLAAAGVGLLRLLRSRDPRRRAGGRGRRRR